MFMDAKCKNPVISVKKDGTQKESCPDGIFFQKILLMLLIMTLNFLQHYGLADIISSCFN